MVVRKSVRGGREEREEYTNRLLWGLGNMRGGWGDKMEGYRRQTEPNVSHGASVGFNYTQTLSDLRLRLDLRVSSQTNSKPAPSPPAAPRCPAPI